MELTDEQIELLHGAYDVIVKHPTIEMSVAPRIDRGIFGEYVREGTLTWEDLAQAFGYKDHWELSFLVHRLARENKW